MPGTSKSIQAVKQSVKLLRDQNSYPIFCCANIMKNDNTFNGLSLNNKELLLEDLGTELWSIEFYDHRIHLYEMNNLLIEVFQNIETRKIERITTADYGSLDKFLMRITLGPLTSNGKALGTQGTIF
jgi:hypothetical protein